MTIECSRNSPPIFTNFYEQAANFDEIICPPRKVWYNRYKIYFMMNCACGEADNSRRQLIGDNSTFAQSEL